MAEDITVSEFSPLFRNNRPLLDVRSSIEYQRGAFPNAYNLPLLTDIERKVVGIRFKEAGQAAAVKLGEELVSEDTRATRITLWSQYFDKNPTAALYCFRGGLRSKTAQKWLLTEGIDLPVIQGGYKALRRYCINILEKVAQQKNFIVIGGKTGCAKTHLLRNHRFILDLEGRANHRGSAFGHRIQSQPNQINFENQLAIDLIQLEFNETTTIFIEDESRAIGSLSVPLALHRSMSTSPLAVIEERLDFRVETILKDYINSNFLEYKIKEPARYRKLFSNYLLSALSRIQRRLGDEHYVFVKNLMSRAVEEYDIKKSNELHRAWIKKLLDGYYDPMYEYQLAKKYSRIVFRGTGEEFLNWSKAINNPS